VWRHDFYAGVPRKRWLEHCAERFTGLEINGTFYRQQSAGTFRDWRRRTPRSFRFTLKGHRFITHNKKLLDPDEPIVRQRDPARALGQKLGAVLWQLPEMLKKDMIRLHGFARALRRRWRGARHAIEFRNPSWFDDEVAACLRDHHIAVCLSDAADFPMWERVTADLVYVRLHGRPHQYASSYGDEELAAWAGRTRAWLSEGRDVHIYFDNDAEGAAPRNALSLLGLLDAPG
jgi:uncharacterized protein YecE (DUF72 family)